MVDTTPLLKTYAAYRKFQYARQDPAAVQQKSLLGLLAKGLATKFGRDHGFHRIRTVEEYQKGVPLRTYERFWDEYLKGSFPRCCDLTWPGMIPYFAVSSGTSSGTTKYLPLTYELLRSINRSGVDLLVHHVNAYRGSRLLGGTSLVLGGSTDLVEQAPGVFSGDLSGITAMTMPSWARSRSFPGKDITYLKDWEQKIDLMARGALTRDIRLISGVPSWMMILFERLFSLRPDAGRKLAPLFPNLELVVHGGVNFAPYIDQFRALLEGSRAELREVYPASEGFIAVADRGYGEGLRLVLDKGLFYEFVPLEELGSPSPTRHWIANVQPGVNYALVLTTCGGLWSYILGDTVSFTETRPARVLITGRTSYYLSAFGEHLIAAEVEAAVSHAAESIGSALRDYSVGAVYPSDASHLGGHRYVVEFAAPPPPEKLETFAKAIDERLCKLNEDYEAHRAKGFGLKPPAVLPVPPGAFAAWMKSRGKLGGQHKVPRIISDSELFSHLTGFMTSYKA